MSLIFGIYQRRGKLNHQMYESSFLEFLNYKRSSQQTIESNSYKVCILNSNNKVYIEKDSGIQAFLAGKLISKNRLTKYLSGQSVNLDNDAEILYKYFREFNDDKINDLRGHFIGGWGTQHEFVILSDYFGTQPLFLYETDDFICFSSRVEPILKLDGFKKDLDITAIADYFINGVVLDNRTFFKEISLLPAGQYLTFCNSEIQVGNYKKINKTSSILSIEESAYNIFNSLKVSIAESIKAYSINESAITGGADTRLILALMSDEDRNKFSFWTEGGNPFHKNGSLDAIVATELAEKYNLKHQVFYKEIIKVEGDILPPSEISMPEKYIFNYEYEPTYRFTGKFGTEFLGGTIWGLIDENRLDYSIKERRSFIEAFFSKKAFMNMDNLQYSHDIEDRVGENEKYSFGINTLLRSYFTSYYARYDWAWVQPFHFAHNMFISPFIDKDVLQNLLNAKVEDIKEYKLYGEIFKTYCKDFTLIPFNSLLAQKRKEFELAELSQIEKVKQQQIKKPSIVKSRPRHLEYLYENRNCDLFKEMNIFNLKNPLFTFEKYSELEHIKLANLLVWYKRYF